MKVIRLPSEMQEHCLRLRASGRSVGCVPTMGFLHDGHLSLIRTAKAEAELVAVSLFVNPAQFGPREDYAAYPRDLDRDKRLCEEAGVDMLFCPSDRDMYLADHGVFVTESRLSKELCGRSRPGHFQGVLTVVAKLFNIVLPTVAVFGQKDAQQTRLIQKLVTDLTFPVRIIVAPTVRDLDGLALSSRNRYLSSEERKQALSLPASLKLAELLYRNGETSTARIKEAMLGHLKGKDGIEIDYLEVVDFETMEAICEIERRSLVALAARVGKTRLIDNIVIGPAELPNP